MPEIDDDELAAELDALGDEIALDDDTSYLDDASKAPAVPGKEPGADSLRNKVYTPNIKYKANFFNKCLIILHIFFFQDGVLVDEFGLPQIPAT